ncbi:hypothetical protein [Sphaerimonospora thailandensis]|uniref:hypothetical protein n=1 Tax=Sphaerimonospora thailandensis TaxID=795644 RepID=UPI001951B4DB|nr:hypothetical protein [Sphaerimonospora thailandensis]
MRGDLGTLLATRAAETTRTTGTTAGPAARAGAPSRLLRASRALSSLPILLRRRRGRVHRHRVHGRGVLERRVHATAAGRLPGRRAGPYGTLPRLRESGLGM